MKVNPNHKAYKRTARIISNENSPCTLKLDESQINFTMIYIQLNNELKSSQNLTL